MFTGKALQRGQQAHNLFLADLAGSPDAVMRRAGQDRLVDEGYRWIPLWFQYVHVQVLERHAHDEVPAAAEDAGTLGSADGLAAAEGHEVGPLRYVSLKVRPRRQLPRGIDNHRYSTGVGDFNDIFQGRQGAGMGDVAHGRRALRDGVGDLPCFRVPHAGPAVAVRDPHFHELYADRPDRVVVEIPLAAGHDDFVLHALRVRQPVHLARVRTGDTGRGAQEEPRRRA